jgi:membrane protease YdiL (CAAX protease family)
VIRFYSFLKVVFYTIVCYTLLLVAGLPIFLIPDSYYPNILSSILIKESIFLISGLVIIIFSKYFGIYTDINFRLFKTILYYILTVFVIIIFCYILYLLNVIDFNLLKITSLNSFGKFLIYCVIPTFFIGFGEEFIFRWFLINRLRTFLNKTSVIIISSLIFCLGHNMNLPVMLFTFTGGCFFALIYLQKNSIFYCISIHAAWNFGQRFFFNEMSEFTYNAQRLLLLDIKDRVYYNWIEFFYCLSIFAVFAIVYLLQDKKSLTSSGFNPGVNE